MTGAARPRRRLSALEAAAATAVIVASLGALGMMTGVLPSPLTTPVVPVTAPANAVATTDTGDAADTRRLAPSGGASAEVSLPIANATALVETAALPTLPPSPTSLIPTDMLTEGPMASSAPVIPAPGNLSDPAAVGTTTVLPPLAAAPPRQKRHRRAQAQVHHPPAGTRPAGKTREQVMAELLQSKRDGTYPANSETYR